MSLKDLRKKKNLSQTALATLSGVSKSAVESYEQGKRNINQAELGTLISLATVLDCKIGDLLTDEELKKGFENVK